MASISRADKPRARLLRPAALSAFAALTAAVLAVLFVRAQDSKADQGESGEPSVVAPRAASVDARTRSRAAPLPLHLPLDRDTYARLAAEQSDPAWFEAAARRFLGARDYRFAAELLFLARHRALDPARSRELYLAGIRALQAGNLPREALDAAQKELGSLEEDESVLLELVQVARAANRSDVAAHFMSRVIWLRQKPAARPRSVDLLALLIPSAWAADPPAARMRGFDSKVYELAYDVFLSNQDLLSAYRVAREAVAQRPQDAKWRERLARVCEQSGKPGEALAAWRWVAEHTDAAEAWQAILRLAPGLNDEAALVAALRRRAQHPGASAADLRALADAYDRLGRPEEGVAWFEARYRSTGNPMALERAAGLAEQMGNDNKAITLGIELLRKAPTAERALRVASLQMKAGRFAEAHALLARHRARAGVEAHEFWKLLADLAWNLQAEVSAAEALGMVAKHNDATAVDFERLIALLRGSFPDEAARVAQAGFARVRAPGLLISALEILHKKDDLAGLKRAYAGVRAEDEALFAQDAYFYRLRAQFRRMSGDRPGARADMQRAREIAPEDPEQRLAMLWMLVELRERDALRRGLLAETPRAAQDNELWSPLAAGWMTLDEPRRALPFLARLVHASPRDLLWLVTYAEALEQDGQLDAADRVRRHAWTVARDTLGIDKSLGREQRERLARLALRQTPGDSGLGVLRELLRRDERTGNAAEERQRRAAADELVLSWLLSHEQHEQAKAWLWERYARYVASPAWAHFEIVLAENDAAGAGRLLDARGAELSSAQRAQAARLAGRPQLALAHAFDAHAARPGDDALHLELSEALLDDANRLGGGLAYERRGVVESRPRDLETWLAVTPAWRVGAQWREASQRSLDENALRDVPAQDRAWRAAIRRIVSRGWAEAGIGAREGFADSISARLRYFHTWSRRLSALATFARNERTYDSPALAVAGMRDELSLHASYEISRTEFLNALVWGGKYRSQNGVVLGGARGYELEAGHRARIDYPDITVRAFAAVLRTNTVGSGDPATASLDPSGVAAPGFFVPEDSRRLGVGIGLGESVREGWTRALRPYAGLDLTHNSASGGGYYARLGLRSSVLGPDRLWLYWARGSSVGANNDTTHEYGVRYEYRFDRS